MSICTVPPKMNRPKIGGRQQGRSAEVDGGRFLKVARGETCWQIRSELEAEFLNQDGLKLGEWQRQGLVEVVKTGPHREVVCVTLPSGRFYIKHYKTPDLQALLQNVVRAPKAVLERRIAEKVGDLGIPTFETVAWGETRRMGVVRDNYLISREIPDAIPLNCYLRDHLPQLSSSERNRARMKLAVALGEFTARLHNAGVVHRDYHAGNILVRRDRAGGMKLWLIDLHCAHVQEAFSLRDARRNLALLHQFFATYATRADRCRFFHAYWKERGLPGSCHDIALDVQAYCSSWAQRQWRRKDRKWKRGTRHLLKLQSGASRCRGLTVLGKSFLRTICQAPETLFDFTIAWHKQSLKRRVAAITLDALPENPLPPNAVAYWKCTTLRGIAARLSQFLGRSSVRRAWENGHALLRRDIATPRPLLFVESVEPGLVRQYLLTESIPNSATLFEFGLNHLQTLPPLLRRQRLGRLSTHLALSLKRMHACGFEHRDLKSKNILVSLDPDDDRTWLLDLEAVRRWPKLPRDRVLQNLSRLCVSSLYLSEIGASDRLRFLRSYLGSRYSVDWKTTWRKIDTLARRKIDRNRRIGRPLS